MTQLWRKIEDEQQSGDFNMAADQYLLEHFSYGDSPQLRFYTWSPLTLSLGRNEKIEEELIENCTQNNIKTIRRLTGGQAVLHGKDLTYSIVAEVGTAPFVQGVLGNYQRLSEVFMLFFRSLGFDPQLLTSASKPSKKKSHVCFATPAAFEILIEGKKIIGNAQKVRMLPKDPANGSGTRKRVFLQHGSIAIYDSVPILATVFSDYTEAQLYQETTSLESIGCLKQYSIDSIKNQLSSAFQKVFNIQWDLRPWSQTEIQKIQEITVSH